MFNQAQIGVIAGNGVNQPVGTTSDLTFTTNTNLINTAQVFTAVGGFGFGHTGLDNLFLAANENGRIYTNLVASGDNDYVFGINTANAEVGLAGMELAYDRSSGGNLYRFMSSTPYDTGFVPSNGTFLALDRCGPMWKAKQSADEVTWTDIPEFLFSLLFSSDAAAYIVCDLHTLAVMSYPKVTKFSSGNRGINIIQDGDSIAFGVLSTPTDISKFNIGFQTYSALQAVKETWYKNVAASGASITSRNAALATAVYPLFGQVGNSFSKIIVCFNCGVNQLAAETAASVFTSLQTYINNILNQDSRTCVLVNTVINCDPAYVTQVKIDAYNALVLGMTETARLKVNDTTTEPLLTAVGACNDTTYYQTDKIHQTQAGINLLSAMQYAKALTF